MHLFGWGDPKDEISKTKEKAQRIFNEAASSDERFMVFSTPSDKKRLMGYEFARKVFGKDLPNYAQPIGSCVGYGAKNAVEYTSAFEVAIGELEEFKLMYLPYIWAGARKASGYRRKGEGAFGTYAAKAVMDYGTIAHDVPGLPVHYTDIPANISNDPKVRNNAAIETDWSGPDRDGTWDFEKFLTYGRQHQILSTAKITTWEQAVSAICNGYFLTIASDQGFEMKARSDGFHYPRGNWAHQMSAIGIDDEFKEPHIIILNSWGENLHGQLTDFKTGAPIPKGCLRVRASVFVRMMQDECFAYSKYNGFPRRILPTDVEGI